MKYLSILLVFWGFNTLATQYDGGSGDGFNQSGSIQLDLEGLPGGVRPLYAGGAGDGFDLNQHSAALNGQEAMSIYGGGSGDGFDRLSAQATLSGEDISGLFQGGSGDGFDRLQNSLTLSGDDFSGLFGGGSGDGFDRLQVEQTLDGTELAGLFGGGPGDGFDQLSFNGILSGDMLMLYGGGSGDGFDRDRASASLGGFDLASLYGGGVGDGFDVNRFEGIVPLPLTLISFDALPQVDFVLLRWVTEDEVATDFFTIEKTRDGRDFAWVGDTPAAGFSEPGERIHYEMEDHDPYLGTSFYRLQTTDFDGAISLSHLVEVNYSQSTAWDFALFPNPNTGKHFSLRPEGLESGADCLIELIDAQGRLLYQQRLPAEEIDGNRFELREPLPGGSYLIRLSNRAGESKAKILIVGARR